MTKRTTKSTPEQNPDECVATDAGLYASLACGVSFQDVVLEAAGVAVELEDIEVVKFRIDDRTVRVPFAVVDRVIYTFADVPRVMSKLLAEQIRWVISERIARGVLAEDEPIEIITIGDDSEATPLQQVLDREWGC